MRGRVRGQAILLTALIIAVAVLAVLLLQSATSASPGYGGVRAAYGVFSRDVSKAVEALSSYVDYMGVITLLNYSRSSALYALPAAANAELYSRWLHVNKTAQAANASAAFFILNRGALGLSVLLPSGFSYSNGWVLLSVPRYFYAAAYLKPVPNGTSSSLQGLTATLYFDGSPLSLGNFQLITACKNINATYRVSVVMNVSLLALAGLNITSEMRIQAKFLEDDCKYCINITTSKPYGWVAYFTVLNRTIILNKEKNCANSTYQEVPINSRVVNYTERSAVYALDLGEKKYIEPIIVVYVGNVPLYLSLHDPNPNLLYICTLSGKIYIKNSELVPVVLYNTTNANIDSTDVGHNVTRLDFSFRDWKITYWVIHSGGYLNLINLNLPNLPLNLQQATSQEVCLPVSQLQQVLQEAYLKLLDYC